ncbi:MAG: aldehyde dehydrogenase [Burkholderiales bacterium]|nr:aldehyde dehydrogenase [Burkholderiales bacterium]ODU68016.1 MAG: aldehyde dehydrogenase [Lautropia sp. SCN 66-9]
MNSFNPDSVSIDRSSFIGGEFAATGGTAIGVFRPSDGHLACEFREATADCVDRAVESARSALRVSGWSDIAPRQRAAVMRHWASLVDEHRVELARLESLCSSRPIAETMGRDLPVVAELLRFYAECADKSPGEVFDTARGILSFTQHEPYGVVAAITPWNVPLLLATAKFAPALAAGNAVVLKPSELTPFAILRIAALGVRAGVPPGLFNVLIGSGAITGNALVRHPGVGYVTFTGSTQTGVTVMCEAAQHGIKPVSLELGGKSPQLVFDDAPDVAELASLVAASLTRNSGQICFCGSRLIVQRGIADELIARVLDEVRAVQAGPTWHEATTLPPIISADQANRIDAIVKRAKDAGAQTLVGGKRFEHKGGQFFEPTVLTGMDSTNDAVRSEIFGPVLTVQVFDDYDEGLALAAHPTYGLAAGVHTRDIDKALASAREIEAGTVWVNTYGRGNDVVSPFGGFKQSGFGKDFGLAAFDKYRRIKNLYIRADRDQRRTAPRA